MSLMAYIIRPHLLRAYKDGYYGQTSSFYDHYADAHGRSLADNGISKKQFLYDNEALYGAITTLSGLSYAVEIVYRHMESTDGIAAFIDLIAKYNGSTRVRRLRLTNILHTPYNARYPGGLTRYVINFEQAYALQDQLELTLAQEENRNPVLDSQTQRREKLINCLYAEPSMRPTVRICLAADYLFDRMIEFLGNEAFAVNHYDQVEATQRAQPR